MESVRTPDQRFANLPDYPFEPHYLELIDGLRLHYLDEGPKDGPVFLCLHGEPTWSYLYRKMIPVFVAAGGRVLAPDWYGFGRSDKPTQDADYTFAFHRQTMLRFVEELGLERDVTLVCQDWGGLLGLTLPVDKPELLSRLIVMNTAIATGMSPGKGFLEWRDYVAKTPDFDVAGLMRRAAPELSDAELKAYNAPFPGPEFKAGVRRFPAIVAIRDDMEGADIGKQAAMFWSTQWSGKSFMAIGMKDPVLGPKVMGLLRGLIRGCPEPLELEAAGHFVQEQGEVVAKAALESFA
ncbi:MAG: haloalkane dehalogenase [Myxococcota bacterium]